MADVLAHARCTHCGSTGGLHPSVQHVEPGKYSVEPVLVCDECRPQHDKDVWMTYRFRCFADEED